jgi:hypothetical protein
VIGTIRSRVSHFTNKFRELGFIEYQAGEELRVHSSLLNIVLLDFVPKRKRTPPRIRITKDVPVRRIDHISIEGMLLKCDKSIGDASVTPIRWWVSLISTASNKPSLGRTKRER